MSSKITEPLEKLDSLEEAAQEIENASRKIMAYDRYYSQGGSESDSFDYFEVQRILAKGEDNAVSRTPKIPIRSDLEFMAEALCFYLERIDQIRIGIETVKGFILPENLSPGEQRELVDAANKGSNSPRYLHILRSSGDKDFIYTDALKRKLTSNFGENPGEKIRKLMDVSSSGKPIESSSVSGSNRLRTLEVELIEKWESGALGSNSSRTNGISDVRQLKTYLKTSLEKGCDVQATEEDIDEIIEVMSRI